ncbi:MAG: tyrosine--tRNA ligase [Puniceicoccales bacterium]|nr:tyrosine--tRNA ligase [Puniceicoccales bacterium]
MCFVASFEALRLLYNRFVNASIPSSGKMTWKKLASGKRLKIKLGIDPTRLDLHLGHLVVFNKLKQFQDFGHETTLLIGDYPMTIGDPSGRSAERPMLSKEQIQDNYQTYVEQAFKVLDPDKTIIRKNSEWFDDMSFGDAVLLARQMTVAQMVEREDFDNRYQNKTPISIVEIFYPWIQGYDSIMLDADVEIGGRDQLVHLLVGRTLQKNVGREEQAVIIGCKKSNRPHLSRPISKLSRCNYYYLKEHR